MDSSVAIRLPRRDRLRRNDRSPVACRLLLGVTFALIPHGDITASRWVAIAVAGAAFVLELCWQASAWILEGSPMAVFDGQPDEPKEGVSALRLRRARPLRRLARFFRPLV